MERVPNPEVYRLVRGNVRELLAGRPDAAGEVVPACPDWRVRDLVAHLLDICEQAVGLVTGRLAGPVRTDTPRSEGPGLPELLALWEQTGTRLDGLIAGSTDPRIGMMTHDAFSHELDLRVAVGAPPPAGHPGYANLPVIAVRGFFERMRELGLPALRIETPGERWESDPDAAGATVLRAGRHDLYRSLTGRRTHEQIAALEWSGDPAPWLPAFTRGPFRPPERPTEELAARS